MCVQPETAQDECHKLPMAFIMTAHETTYKAVARVNATSNLRGATIHEQLAAIDIAAVV